MPPRSYRCYFYDSQGNPRLEKRNGKPAVYSQDNCPCNQKFVHPKDSQWAELPASKAPAFLRRTPSPPRSPGRGRPMRLPPPAGSSGPRRSRTKKISSPPPPPRPLASLPSRSSRPALTTATPPPPSPRSPGPSSAHLTRTPSALPPSSARPLDRSTTTSSQIIQIHESPLLGSPVTSTSSLPLIDTDESSLSRLVQLRANYAEVADRYNRLQQTIEDILNMTSSLPSSSQDPRLSRLQTRRDGVKQEMDVAHRHYKEYERRLKMPSSLPATSSSESGVSSLKGLLKELKLKINEVETLQRELAKLPSGPEDQVDRDGDVGMKSPLSGANKRKRPQYDTIGFPSNLDAHFAHLEKSTTKVAKYVATVGNNIDLQEEELIEMVQAYFRTVDFKEPAQKATDDKTAEDIEQLNHIKEQLSELGNWTAELAIMNEKLEAEQRALLKEKEVQQVDLQKLLARLEGFQKEQEKDDTDLEKLSITLASYMDRSVSPAVPHFVPEEVTADLEEEITNMVRSAVRPHINDLRADLVKDLVEFDSKSHSSITQKLDSAQEGMKHISTYIGH